MLISDFLNQYRSDNSFQQMFKTTELMKVLKSDDKLSGLCFLLTTRYDTIYKQFHPDHVQWICDSLELSTIDDVYNLFSELNGNTMQCLYRTIKPTVDIGVHVTIPAETLKRLVFDSLGEYLSGNCRVIMLDREYRLPLFKTIRLACELCASESMAYSAEDADCDDFVRMFRGFLSSAGLGNVSIGSCVLDFYVDGKSVSAHAMLIAIDNYNNFYMVEPQNDSVSKVDEYFSRNSNAKIRSIEF